MVLSQRARFAGEVSKMAVTVFGGNLNGTRGGVSVEGDIDVELHDVTVQSEGIALSVATDRMALVKAMTSAAERGVDVSEFRDLFEKDLARQGIPFDRVLAATNTVAGIVQAAAAAFGMSAQA